MARPASNRTLKGHVTRLQRQLEAAHKTLRVVAAERDDARAEIEEAKQSAETYRTQWLDGIAKSKELEREVREDRETMGRLRQHADEERALRLRVEAERDRDRGYIEGLLDGLHPARPQLPWETVEVTREVRGADLPAFADWSSDTPKWRR